jgi:hypothetical protein
MVFIDIYISYKTMSLVFLIAGATVGAARIAGLKPADRREEAPPDALGATAPG